MLARFFRGAVVGTVALLLLGLGVPSGRASSGGSLLPKPGTPASAVDPRNVAGAYPLDEHRWAVPLRAAPPDWLTPQLLAAADRGPTAAPTGAVAPDAPLSGYVGIRPGSEMVSPSGCTMNFVFGSPGAYTIGTAGHCAKAGQKVTLLTIAPGTPPSPQNLVLVTIGTVKTSRDGGIGNDFALVSIKPELQSWVFPTIAQVGGPCGTYTRQGLTSVSNPTSRLVRGTSPIEAGETIFHYGHGLGIGTGGTARAGAALYWTDRAYYWAGAVMFGDSGSAARVGTMPAAGNVTHLVVDLRYPGGYNAGTRITRMGTPVDSPYCP